MNASTETNPAAKTFPAATGSLHLQYVGEHVAIEVESLLVGCVTVWNGGGLEMCVGVTQVSPKFFALQTKSIDYMDGKLVVRAGEPFTRRCKVGRMVGYSPKATAQIAAQ